MAYLLYTLYNWNLEKFRKGNKESIFYKAKIISAKISVDCTLFVLFLFTIDSLREVTGQINHTIADVHTHPDPGAYAPSAHDLLAIDHKHNLVADFNTMYTISPDGSKYALYISDASKLNDFMNNNSGFVGSDNNFAAGTASGNLFRSTIRDLQQRGYPAMKHTKELPH